METQRADAVSAMASAAAFDGWSSDIAATHTADELGISVLRFRRLVGRTPKKRLLSYFELLSSRMSGTAAADDSGFSTMRIREKIGFLMFTRLHACEQDNNGKEALRRAAAYLINPLNVGFTLRAQFSAADAIWREAGDTSTDFNYYSKRTLAGGIYAASLFYYLDDTSENHQETRNFIDRRIDNVMSIEKGKATLKQALPAICGTAKS